MSQEEINRKSQKFAVRLRHRRNRLGLSQDALAEAAGVSSRSIFAWEKGESMPNGQKLQKVAVALGVEIPWLFGEESKSNHQEDMVLRENHAPLRSDVRPDFSIARKVPVVSWASAGYGANYSDLAEQIDEWIDTDCKDPNAYALIVDGDSMEPVLRPGDKIVVAPNREAQNGQIVVARLREDGQVLLKLFHQTGATGETIRLTSYNPAYPILEYPRSSFRFIQPIWALTRQMMR